jgi:hypothetical protein
MTLSATEIPTGYTIQLKYLFFKNNPVDRWATDNSIDLQLFH